MRYQEKLKAWLLSIVLGKTIKPQDILDNTEYQEILKKGGFSTGNFQVTFQVPQQKIFVILKNGDADLFKIKSDPKLEQNLVNLTKDKPSFIPS